MKSTAKTTATTIMPTTITASTVTTSTDRAAREERGIGRRALLTGGAAGLGALLGVGGTLGAQALRVPPAAPGAAATAESVPAAGAGGTLPGFGAESLPCHGTHQAGVVSAPAAHAHYAAYRLHPETDAAALQRLFRVLTDDIEGLTSGAGPLADPEVELAARPARLTITVGVGRELVTRAGSTPPEWLGPLPAFSLDEFDDRFVGGDLLLLVQADDPLPISHAIRMLNRDLASFAGPLWTQRGFRQARGAEADGTTMRNLMGQIDGTVNPSPAGEDFGSLVWHGAESGWLEGGSAFVLRRIRMELDTWDMVDRPGREQSVGRRLSDGSPLSVPEGEGDEHTPVDFDATNELGLSAIPMAAHIRRAHSTDPSEQIFRQTVNYDEGGESGLLFGCYQRNPLEQFVPIQQRLDEADLLNEWVTHVGSAVFAILPGFGPDELIGETLFS